MNMGESSPSGGDSPQEGLGVREEHSFPHSL